VGKIRKMPFSKWEAIKVSLIKVSLIKVSL